MLTDFCLFGSVLLRGVACNIFKSNIFSTSLVNDHGDHDRPFWVLKDGIWLDNAHVDKDSIVISDSVVTGDVVQKIIIENPEKVQDIVKQTLASLGFSGTNLPLSDSEVPKEQINNTISLADYVSSFGVDFNGWTELSLGYACEAKGDFLSAESHFTQALEFGKQNQDERLQLHSELGFIILIINEQKFNQAEERCIDLLDKFAMIGDDEGLSNSRELLGLISYSKGRYEKSREYHEEALQIRQSKGDKEAVISSKINLANVAMSEGKVREAGALLDSLDTNYTSKKDEAQLICSRGVNELQNDNYDKAILLLKQSLEIRKEISDRIGESESYNYIGTAKMLDGKIYSGYADCETAYKIAKQVGNNNLMAHALYNMGQGSFGLNNPELARSELLMAAKLFEQVDNFRGVRNCENMLNQIGKIKNSSSQILLVILFIMAILILFLMI